MKNFETIIVDNGSTDDSVSFVQEKYPSCRLISFSDNKGFSAAVNAGILAAKGKYIVLLNNDTKSDKNFLAELCFGLDEHQEAGFCASKMLSYDDPSVIDGVGDYYLKGGRAFKFGWAEKDLGQYDHQLYIFGACAGAAIYRKTLFEEIGLFDDEFFAYLEDVDISFRAQLAGYKCLYVPKAIVYHIGSASTGSRVNNTTVFLSAKNYVNVLVKDLPAQMLLENSYWIFRTVVMTFLRYIYYGKGFSLAWVYLKGLFAGLRQFPSMREKRKVIQKKIKNESVNYIRDLMIQSEKIVREGRTRRPT